MDHDQFDALTRTVTPVAPSRRAMLRLFAGTALGGVVRLGGGEFVEAKRKKKKKKAPRCGGASPVQCPPPANNPKAVCYPTGTHCCSSAVGGGACYIGNACCPPSVAYPGGSCAMDDEVCCSAAAGGGSCSLSSPVCCAPSQLEPEGSCVPKGATCCPLGGYCDAGESCCPPSPDFPYGSCAPAGGCFALTAADGLVAPVRRSRANVRSGRLRLAADRRDQPNRQEHPARPHEVAGTHADKTGA
jgi:hypothetical protein